MNRSYYLSSSLAKGREEGLDSPNADFKLSQGASGQFMIFMNPLLLGTI